MGKAGGILGGVRKDKFDVTEVSRGRFHVKVTVFHFKIQLKWCWIIIYRAAHEEEKENFLIELAEVCADQSLPLLIGGDFNLLRFASEKNEAIRSTRCRNMFNNIINIYELRELDMSGG